MFNQSVACIEKITLKVRLVQNKISHGVNGSMNTRTIMMQRVACCTPTVDTHRSFFVKKGKKFNSLSNNLYGLPGVGKITTSSLTFFVSLC